MDLCQDFPCQNKKKKCCIQHAIPERSSIAIDDVITSLEDSPLAFDPASIMVVMYTVSLFILYLWVAEMMSYNSLFSDCSVLLYYSLNNSRLVNMNHDLRHPKPISKKVPASPFVERFMACPYSPMQTSEDYNATVAGSYGNIGFSMVTIITRSRLCRERCS